jgi:DNA-binding response OmpR family regulator
LRFTVLISSPNGLGSRLAMAAEGYSNLKVEVHHSPALFATNNHIDAADAIIIHAGDDPAQIAELCRRIRDRTDCPLLVLADRHSSEAAVAALDAGADHCLPATAFDREIWARVRGQLRRVHEYSRREEHGARFEVGSIVVDTSSHEAFCGNRHLDLTPKEFELLTYLVRNAGRAVPREELLTTIWRLKPGMDSRTLDVHVGRLRTKIGNLADGRGPIATVSGVGYKFAE